MKAELAGVSGTHVADDQRGEDTASEPDSKFLIVYGVIYGVCRVGGRTRSLLRNMSLEGTVNISAARASGERLSKM